MASVEFVVARHDQHLAGEGVASPVEYPRALVDVTGEHRHVRVEHLGLEGRAAIWTQFQVQVREEMDTHEVSSWSECGALRA